MVLCSYLKLKKYGLTKETEQKVETLIPLTNLTPTNCKLRF